MQSGLVHIYTGEGKGKTTAALGLCLRALGAGKRVFLVQFLKKGEFSELKALKKFEMFKLKQFGFPEFVDPHNVSIRHKKVVEEGFDFAKKLVFSDKYDLLVLDEILIAVQFKLLKLEAVLNLIESKHPALELVLTGRGAGQKLIDAADLVSYIKEIKHPFQQGIKARVGIEY